MKNDDLNPNDGALNKALGEWRVTTPLPPRFRQQVWQRIERAETVPSVWTLVRHWFDGVFAKPAFAVAYVTVLIFAGLMLGFQQARAKTAHLENTLGTLYVQAIDPYQSPRH